MRLGILGVGHLATAMIAGLVRSGMPAHSMMLSPRGRAAEVSTRYGIPVAADNASLVAACDVVILAVRPVSAPAAVAGLPWRDGQVVVSVCAGVPLAQLAVAPASAARAMPYTAAEIGASPTVYFPRLPVVHALLERMGPAIPLASEDEFEIATVSAAAYGWAQDLIRRTANWSVAQGGDPTAMRLLVAQTFVAAGRLIAEKSDTMEKMLEELVTPGGITELGLNTLAAGGQPDIWQKACEAVLDRLRAVAP